MISWEGKCCNGMKYYDRDRGSMIIGTTGIVIIDRDGYEIYDLKGNEDQRVQGRQAQTSSADLSGRDSMTDRALRELHRRHSEGREAERAGCHGQCRGDDAATVEHRVGGQARTASRSDGRQGAERSGGDEVLGPRV